MIALGIIASYIVIGVLMIPGIARHKLRNHIESGGQRCDSYHPYGYTYTDNHGPKEWEECAAGRAAWMWMGWPIFFAILGPTTLARKALESDRLAAVRVKELEAKAVEDAKRLELEEKVRRENDPFTMTMDGFDRKMREAVNSATLNSKTTKKKVSLW